MKRISINQAGKFKIRDMLLKALTFSSGAIDAISFLALGKVFTAFMTGNVAFLGLRVAGNAAPPVISILASMIPFAIGVYVATRIGRSVKEPVSWPRQVTVALTVSLIAQAAFLAIWFGVGGSPANTVIPYLLGFWAFAMGMQSAAVRTPHVDGVFTTAATATIIFLAGDLAKWSATAAERRRLAGVLFSLFAGATAGGWLLIHAHLYAPVLPFVISGVVVVIAALTNETGLSPVVTMKSQSINDLTRNTRNGLKPAEKNENAITGKIGYMKKI